MFDNRLLLHLGNVFERIEENYTSEKTVFGGRYSVVWRVAHTAGTYENWLRK